MNKFLLNFCCGKQWEVGIAFYCKVFCLLNYLIFFSDEVKFNYYLHFRIQYCTQEIIVFREDLVNKMCRNCIRFPSSNLDIPNHVS